VHFTEGPIRYRVAWAKGGKRRAVVWRVAENVASRSPDLVNDPTQATWEAVVYESASGPERILVELVPRTDDPRFVYRRGDVPAASHPTIAAALVRIAGPRADDVVWDPFVGSGIELCERHVAGPYRRLIGSDRDAAALDAARANLDAVGARAAMLYAGDARTFVPPEAPTLIITNPPMGRRVVRGSELEPLLAAVLTRAATILAPEGRLVWVSPLPRRLEGVIARAGLEIDQALEVDMGGFGARLQRLTLPPKGRKSAAKVHGQEVERSHGRTQQKQNRNDDDNRHRGGRPPGRRGR
jgi:predicted RNA methylase